MRRRQIQIIALGLLALGCARSGFGPQDEVVLVFEAGEEESTAFEGAQLDSAGIEGGAAVLASEPGFAELIDRLPTPAAAASAAAVGGIFYVAGGNEAFPSQLACSDQLLALDPDAGELVQIGQIPHPKRGMVALQYADRLHLLMGFCSGQSDAEEAKVYRMDPAGAVFEHLGSFYDPLYYFTAGLVPGGSGELMMTVGGYGSGPITDLIQIFDPQTGESRALSIRLPTERCMMAGASHAGVFYAFGGTGTGEPGLTECSDPTQVDIFAVQAEPERLDRIGTLPAPRAAACAAARPDGRILIFGGERYRDEGGDHYALELLDDVLVFDPSDDSIETYPARLPEPRSAMACACNERGQIALFGGVDAERVSQDQVWIFEPRSASATITGPVADAGLAGMRWTWLMIDADMPAGTSISMSLRIAAERAAFDGDALGWIETPHGPLPPSLPAGRYAQWRAVLASDNPLATPKLRAVSLVYSAERAEDSGD
ncbi:MAG: hypothetical protein JXR96_19835 [Deltaproteobacteria bacterium]|nr:hypothetical protein [Deltaproteobacteria bacterium]